MKTKIDKLLKKLNKHPVDNDKEFLECLIDLDYRVKELEKYHTPTDVGENKLNGGLDKMARKKPYKPTGKYAVGSQWDAKERKIYKDADGKFVFYKGRRIRNW